MTRSAFDDLAHRLANLLGTIEIQAEVARAEGTLAAHQQALAAIAESGRRAQRELAELRRARRAHDAGAGDAGAGGDSSGSIVPSL